MRQQLLPKQYELNQPTNSIGLVTRSVCQTALEVETPRKARDAIGASANMAAEPVKRRVRMARPVGADSRHIIQPSLEVSRADRATAYSHKIGLRRQVEPKTACQHPGNFSLAH